MQASEQSDPQPGINLLTENEFQTDISYQRLRNQYADNFHDDNSLEKPTKKSSHD